MSLTSKLITCIALMLSLAACKSGSSDTAGTDGFIEQVKSVVNTTPDDAEPANFDNVMATSPDNTEPVEVQ